ncbi:malate dehydrogenase [Candidatus Roizmanbacteria bacterium RIFCSPHIGHO2_02_FULL_38_11]|uniref:Malate dehydrogenase n=1 Tax=Candidatus Roizmanbacteria bacterium RIFCSPHIGHO2_02_FULL_38_11 TaxID=1802039 RepID=A0A1F7GZM4_9BACT|nr:MAG: malate dehydrogenase [Candidatus Roizmanbacteria bacterium RIFCSPHIGHO2_02_FULL_38_11]
MLSLQVEELFLPNGFVTVPLSLVYTPGVASVSSYLAKHESEIGKYTVKGNFVAVVSDGSAVLGLGDVGPLAALPVMEGKCALFKRFANIDAVPIVLSSKEPQVIIDTVKAISPTFGAICLEDIASPRCFLIEEGLRKELDIPVVHDDQWGAAVVSLAALTNALIVVKKRIQDVKIVVSGAGAAGSAIVKLIHKRGARNILVCDRAGIIYKRRRGNNQYKESLTKITNSQNISGDLKKAIKGSDVFIGVSSAGIVSQEMVASMNRGAIVFALANPTPEIMPGAALAAGAAVVATGRSDFPNQVNNALAFPGVFRGALDHRAISITSNMLIKAAENLAGLVKKPTSEKIIPSIFERGVVKRVSSAIV